MTRTLQFASSRAHLAYLRAASEVDISNNLPAIKFGLGQRVVLFRRVTVMEAIPTAKTMLVNKKLWKVDI